MRLFVAVVLDEGIRVGLGAVQERLRAADAAVRWVDPAHVHLTVLFLGEREEALLPAIEDACASIAAQTRDFRIRIQGASAFPKPSAPGPAKPLKTLWVGLAEGAGEWKALARRAEEWFVPMGAPRGAELVPHITIGRVKSERNEAALREALTPLEEIACGQQMARGLTLIRSFLDRSGATYQILGFWPFEEVGS